MDICDGQKHGQTDDGKTMFLMWSEEGGGGGGGETKYTMFDLSSVCQFFYKFLTSELVHPYHLDEVISSSW